MMKPKQGSLPTGGWAKALAALMMALLALVATPAAAGAADAARGARTDFTAQARSAGLSSTEAKGLQARVDGYLAKMPGTQVGANKIVLEGGGELLLHRAEMLDQRLFPGVAEAGHRVERAGPDAFS
ncbi:hypothetical protein ABZY16_16570, partial [Streptomyces sp. NPDC006553]